MLHLDLIPGYTAAKPASLQATTRPQRADAGSCNMFRQLNSTSRAPRGMIYEATTPRSQHHSEAHARAATSQQNRVQSQNSTMRPLEAFRQFRDGKLNRDQYVDILSSLANSHDDGNDDQGALQKESPFTYSLCQWLKENPPTGSSSPHSIS